MQESHAYLTARQKQGPALYWLLLGLWVFTGLPAWGQQLDHALGEVLIQPRRGVDIRALAAGLEHFQASRTDFRIRKQLRGELGVWVCSFSFADIHERRFLESLQRHPLVEAAQFNHFLDLRATLPDDPLFSRQWQYLNTGQSGGQPGADLDMELVWDITTGGVTAAGDTIVVCVIDEGLDLGHEDFGANLWVNHAEVPGNGIDDDRNGYVDDYRGWNTLLQNDDIDVDFNHGTPVAGIIGAKGNNGIGVSGLNWNVKLMVIAGGIGLESEALEAYAYPLAQRRRYNASNGREGAFVVASNASWGVNFGDPADFPLWCALYDSLGASGIINVAATIDMEVDVDVNGDMPTTCPSEYLIGVTTTDDSGKRAPGFGYGVKNIDLAAFGEEVWTTATGNRYGAFGGTSGAAPHVAGAVALLYAAPCPTLMAVAQSDPPAAARMVRNYILQGVTPEPTFSGRTLTGGRLGILKSLELLLDNCGECPPPTSLDAAAVTANTAALTWQVNDSIVQVDLRWRPQGATTWQMVRNARSPYRLENLGPCSDYEFQVQAYCRRQTLGFSPSYVFRTDGCCEPPPDFRLTALSDRTAVVQWSPVLAAQQYRLHIIQVGGSYDREFITSRNLNFFNNLNPCSQYEVRIQPLCDNGSADFSPSLAFRTLGCGACLDQPYCAPRFIDASSEWISEVVLNTLEHRTGSDAGYGDFTGMGATELVPGKSYPIRLRPGFAGSPDFEYFQVWIDLNQDGHFSSQEVVFNPGGASRDVVNGTVAIPPATPLGPTRMRVSMRFFRPGGPCSFFDQPFGEIEDFCVSITGQPITCETLSGLDTVAAGATYVDLRWNNSQPGERVLLRFRDRSQTEWEQVEATSNPFRLTGLSKCTEYEAQVKQVCGGIQGLFSPPVVFQTSCTTAADEPIAPVSVLAVFPNPLQQTATLSLSLPVAQPELRVVVFDATGQRIQDRQHALPAGDHLLPLDLTGLPAGVYLLKIMPREGRPAVRRLVKGR